MLQQASASPVEGQEEKGVKEQESNPPNQKIGKCIAFACGLWVETRDLEKI